MPTSGEAMVVFDTLVVATDGSAGVERAVVVAVDLAERFDAAVHAVYVVDDRDVTAAPESVRDEVRSSLADRGEEAVAAVAERADDAGCSVTTTVREGEPVKEIVACVRETDADGVALGASGRHGENSFLVGSVAERVVERSPVPVLTVRREGDTTASAD